MENVKDETVLIMPDVHGRDFWREGIEKRKPGELCIWLGDYPDPYPHELITHDKIPAQLEEIIETPNSVFLLGNHDLSYIYPKVSPAVRKDWDWDRKEWLGRFFEEHHQDFKLTYVIARGDGNHVVFSHAGLIKELYHRQGKNKYNPVQVASMFNEWWEKRDPILTTELFRIGWHRGGWDEVGSLVWADIREHIARRHIFWSHDYQVFGHTMLKTGHLIQLPQFACVDCQRPVRMWWNKKKPVFEIL